MGPVSEIVNERNCFDSASGQRLLESPCECGIEPPGFINHGVIIIWEFRFSCAPLFIVLLYQYIDQVDIMHSYVLFIIYQYSLLPRVSYFSESVIFKIFKFHYFTYPTLPHFLSLSLSIYLPLLITELWTLSLMDELTCYVLNQLYLTKSMAYGTRRFNAAFTRALQYFLS